MYKTEKNANCMTKEELEIQIIKDIKEIKDILDEDKIKDKLFKYEVVRLQGNYNILDPRARQQTGLSKKDYMYIIKNYSKLMNKYTDVRSMAINRIEYLKSAYTAKVIGLKGCDNCREIVSKKLDVKVEDLCENCQKILEQFITYKNLLNI